MWSSILFGDGGDGRQEAWCGAEDLREVGFVCMRVLASRLLCHANDQLSRELKRCSFGWVGEI
jgi:hypothetical protein